MLRASARPGRRPTALLAGPVAVGLLLTGCGSEVRGSIESPEDAVGTVLAQQPCPADSAFECITLAVPADHFADASPLWEATFALHRGAKDSRGVVVTATGGPGSSGIASADGHMASMSPEITDHYDLVFFDQRGIGLSRPFRCDEAMSAEAPVLDSSADDAARDAYAEEASAFVDDCFAEAGVAPDDAPLYATRQAAEDLEVFRSWLHADSLILYGESYGTQYQQTYAAAHPDHVAELLLDGPVDLGTDVLSFVTEAATAYSDVLAATLAACDRDTVCAGDAPGTSTAAYDRLATELAKRPRGYAYPGPDGTREKRRLTLEDLQAAAAGAVSGPSTRAQFQRALNAAVQGDEVPLARLAAAGNGADPGTGQQMPDPTFSDALYYAVECQDYDFVPPGATGRGRLDAWLDAAERAGIDRMRLGDVFYGDLTCLFWPGDDAPISHPMIGTDPPYPVLLLTADTDPNTPTANAERLLGAITGDVALVRQTGGPHVIYGRGEPCIDDLVTDVVTSGRLPGARVTVCPGDELSDWYAPIAPGRADGYDDPDRTVGVILAGVLDDPVVDGWSGEESLTLGCSAGGTADYSMDWLGTVQVELSGCAWTPGVPVDGTVTADDGGYGDVALAVELPFATLNLTTDGALTGTFRGEQVG